MNRQSVSKPHTIEPRVRNTLCDRQCIYTIGGHSDMLTYSSNLEYDKIIKVPPFVRGLRYKESGTG